MRRSFLAVVLFAASHASCGGHDVETIAKPVMKLGGTSGVRPTMSGDRVILVTIDGVRWQDVFVGIDRDRMPGASGGPEATMPRTHALVASRGVAFGAGGEACTSVRTASGTNVSLPGYIEIFTGRKTRCRDNYCPRIAVPTLLDEVSHAQGGSAASISSWDGLARAASSTDENIATSAGNLGWHGEMPRGEARVEEYVEDARKVAPYPGWGLYRPDVYTARIALEYLRRAQPTLLHVGLGDTDEWGHRDDYPAYLAALRQADDFIGDLARELDELGEAGARTTVIVTSDHGRAYDFRDHGFLHVGSERTWVLAFGASMKARGRVCDRADMTLADIAPTVREILGLPGDTGSDGSPIDEILERRPPAVSSR